MPGTAERSAAGFRAGQTGLVVEVPEAEAVVARWRERFDPGAGSAGGSRSACRT
ncbi:hypothetical protein [Kitasatospora sp. NPDC088134]|uniref:hypothetical protein n=1 Tax=Kitasatospora sp. NPDC088134 TaxID=3364071 RepID=UPI00381BB3AF